MSIIQDPGSVNQAGILTMQLVTGDKSEHDSAVSNGEFVFSESARIWNQSLGPMKIIPASHKNLTAYAGVAYANYWKNDKKGDMKMALKSFYKDWKVRQVNDDGRRIDAFGNIGEVWKEGGFEFKADWYYCFPETMCYYNKLFSTAHYNDGYGSQIPSRASKGPVEDSLDSDGSLQRMRKYRKMTESKNQLYHGVTISKVPFHSELREPHPETFVNDKGKVERKSSTIPILRGGKLTCYFIRFQADKKKVAEAVKRELENLASKRKETKEERETRELTDKVEIKKKVKRHMHHGLVYLEFHCGDKVGELYYQTGNPKYKYFQMCGSPHSYNGEKLSDDYWYTLNEILDRGIENKNSISLASFNPLTKIYKDSGDIEINFFTN